MEKQLELDYKYNLPICIKCGTNKFYVQEIDSYHIDIIIGKFIKINSRSNNIESVSVRCDNCGHTLNVDNYELEWE